MKTNSVDCASSDKTRQGLKAQIDALLSRDGEPSPEVQRVLAGLVLSLINLNAN